MSKEPLLQNIGIEDTEHFFEHFKNTGNTVLTKLRANVTAPELRKVLRTWSVTEAAPMIGRSLPWLREHDDATPVDPETGRKVYTLARINELRDQLGTRYRRPKGSEPIIMPVSNFKGGVGKTTTVIHLAQKLALEGLRVLVVDFDSQASCTFALGSYIPDIELDSDDTIGPALIEDPHLIKQAIRATYFTGIDLIPANLSIQDLELTLPNPDLNNHENMGGAAGRLKTALTVVKDNYDVILIDCGPNMGALTTNALVAANALLVPIPPATYDLGSFVMYTSSLNDIFKQLKTPLLFFRILLSKHTNTVKANEIDALIRKIYGEYVMGNAMYTTVEIEKASSEMGSIYETQKGRTNAQAYSRALTCMDNVNNEIINALKLLWEKQGESAKEA
jgi:chromosome partitioning protein